jgi:MarR family 2-MHQ and catechol resistance regulon transcriptional repressor
MATHYKGTKAETAALDAFIKLQRASESIASFLAAHVAEDGLTLPQFGALETLLHLGPLCQKELGRKLLRSGGNVTMVVDNLEKRGLVKRVRREEDRRFMTVHLTGRGRTLIQKAFPRHAAAISEAFSALSRSEQKQIADLCKRVGLSLSR